MATTDETTQQDLVTWADDLLTIPPSDDPLPSALTGVEKWVVDYMNQLGSGYYWYDQHDALHFVPRWTVDNMGGPKKYFTFPYAKQWWFVNTGGIVVAAW
jgi:hypothetical protein